MMAGKPKKAATPEAGYWDADLGEFGTPPFLTTPDLAARNIQ